MPGRLARYLIVVFWLVMTGWLTVREVALRTGKRPQLADVLPRAAEEGEVRWIITQNSSRIGWASTQVTRNPDTGTYNLLQTVTLDRYQPVGIEAAANVQSRTTVDQAGELRRMDVMLSGRIAGQELRIELEGIPDGNGLRIRSKGSSSFFTRDEVIDYDTRDVLMSSLSPLNRMPGLRPGQTWEVPLIDPLGSLGSRVLDRPTVRVQVLDEPEHLFWDRTLVPCWIVHAEGPGRDIRIWVRTSDGAVLKQAGHIGLGTEKTLLEVKREPPAR